MKVKAVFSFEHDGTKRRDDVFDVSDRIGNQLIGKGLVVAVDDGDAAAAAPVEQAQAEAIPVAGEAEADAPVGQVHVEAAPGAGGANAAVRSKTKRPVQE